MAKTKVIAVISLALLLIALPLLGACAGEKEVVREVIKEVPVEKEVVKEVIKEVPVEKVVVKEVPKEVLREVPVVKEVVREVIKEVPVEKVVEKEVVKKVLVEKVIKIGVLTDLTGPAGSILGPIFRGFMDNIRYQNELGGINGIPIKVLWRDTKYTMDLAKTGYEDFVDAGIVLVCTEGSLFQAGLAADFARDKIPDLSSGGEATSLWPPSYTYGMYLPGPDQVAFAADWIKANWTQDRPPRMALIYPDYSPARKSLPGIPYMKQQGIEIVAEEVFPPPALDISAHVLRAKAANPDYYLPLAITVHTALIMKEAKRMGLTATAIWPMGWPWTIAKLAGSIANGHLIGMGFGMYGETDKPGIKAFIDQQNFFHGIAKPEDLPPEEAIIGWARGRVVTEALRLAMDKVGFENLTGETVKKYGFDQIKYLDMGGIMGPYAVEAGVDNRGGRTMRMVKVVDAEKLEFKPISDWLTPPAIKPTKK